MYEGKAGQHEVYHRPELKADNEVHMQGLSGKTIVRRLSVIEQLEDRGDLTNLQCEAGQELTWLLEAAERAVWSLARDDNAPASAFRDPLAAWTKGFAANTVTKRKPPPQMRPYPKRIRSYSDGLTVSKIEAMRGSIGAKRALKAMPRAVRDVINCVVLRDLTVTAAAQELRGSIDGASRRWIMRRLREGLDDLAGEMFPHRAIAA